MQNKTLIAVMLVGMAIGMTSCNNDNSTSTSNKPSDSTSSSSKPSISVTPSTSNSTINKVYVESVENIFGRFFQRSDSGVGKNKVEWCGLFSFVYPSFHSRAVGNVQYPGVDFCRSGLFTYFFNSLQALLVTSADENIFGFRLFGIVKSQRFADS